MAARLRAKHQDDVRSKIKASNIITRLQDFIEGTVQMQPHQVTAALGLLKKCIPDLASVEHSGEVETTYIARVPTVAASTDEWLQQHRPTVQ